MSINKIDSALQSMSLLEAQAKGVTSPAKAINNGLEDFGKVLSNFVNDVNTVKIDSDALQDRYVKGDASVSLPQVMIATQQANVQVSFMTEVRNKLLDAYNEVLRMGI